MMSMKVFEKAGEGLKTINPTTIVTRPQAAGTKPILLSNPFAIMAPLYANDQAHQRNADIRANTIPAVMEM